MDHVKTDTVHMSTVLPLDGKYSDTQKLYYQHLLEMLPSVDVVASEAKCTKSVLHSSGSMLDKCEGENRHIHIFFADTSFLLEVVAYIFEDFRGQTECVSL